MILIWIWIVSGIYIECDVSVNDVWIVMMTERLDLSVNGKYDDDACDVDHVYPVSPSSLHRNDLLDDNKYTFYPLKTHILIHSRNLDVYHINPFQPVYNAMHWDIVQNVLAFFATKTPPNYTTTLLVAMT